MVVHWRIYYDDASTFDSTQGEPWQAPGRGVICIVQVDPSPVMYSVNTQVLRGHPYYWYHREWGYWLHSDRDGFIDQLCADRKDVVCAIKMGRWVAHDYYRDVVEKAKTDPDFPKKSGDSLVEQRYKD